MRQWILAVLCCSVASLFAVPAQASDYYLQPIGNPNALNHVPVATLTDWSPFAPFLLNHDPGRDSQPGLLIQKGGSGETESDPVKHQTWILPGGALDLNGPASLNLWAAAKDFNTSTSGWMKVFLVECDPDGGNCTTLAWNWLGSGSWSGGWDQFSINFGSIVHTIPAGRVLGVKAITHSSSADDMMLAYGTTAYPSSVSVTPVASASTDVNLTVVKSANRSTAQVGQSIVYTVQYNCVSTIAGGQSVTITDVFDPFLTVTGITSSSHVASSIYDPISNTVSVVFVNPLPAGSTGEVQITAEFIPGVTDNYDAPNTASITAINGAAKVSNEVIVTATVPPVVDPPDPTFVKGASAVKTVNSSSVRLPDGKVYYHILHGNTGSAGQDIENYIIEDTFPPQLKLWRFNVGEFSGTSQTINVYYKKNVGGGWILWPGGPWDTNDDDSSVYASTLGLPAGSWVSGLRFDYGTLPGDAGFHPDLADPMDIDLEFADPATAVVGSVMTNCADLTGSEVGGVDTYAIETCVDVTINAPNAGVFFGKTADSGEIFIPGGQAYYDIKHGNTGDTGQDIVNYVVEDVFPVGFKLARFNVGEFHGTSQTVNVSYQVIGSSSWSTWPGGPWNTGGDDAWVYAADLGLGAGSGVSGLRFEFGTLPGGGAFHPNNNDPIDIDLDIANLPSMTVGDIITNCAYLRGTALVGGAAYDEESCADIEVVAAVHGVSVSKWANSSNLELPYEKEYYDIRHGNIGDPGQDVNSYVVEDVFPPELKLWRFNVGEFHGTNQTVAVFYQNNISGTWTVWPGRTRNTNNDDSYLYASSLGLSAGTWVSGLRFDFGTLPGGGNFHPNNSDPIDIDLEASPLAAAAIGTSVVNCATVTAIDAATSEVYNKSYCDDIQIREPDAEYRWNLYDATGSGPYDRWDIVRMGIRLGNDWDNGIPLVNPRLVVLLPEGFTYQDGLSITGAAYTDNGSPPYTLEIVNDFNGTGQQLVRFIWAAFTIPANGLNKDMWIGFDTEIGLETTFEAHDVYLYGSWESPVDGDGVYGSKPVDTLDYDGDGNTTELLASDSMHLHVGDPGSGLASLDSVMGVKGELDSSYSRFPDTGLTVPSGQADYELRITNSGGVALKDLTVIEILPFVGDTGVLDLSARNSEWSPFLVGAVEVPVGIDVYYSTSGNPCRDELTPGIPAGCDPPAWSTALPSNPAAVKSIKLKYQERRWLIPGEEIVISWPMRAPLTAPTNGEIAWSSFGVVGTRADNSLIMLPSEPMKVGIGIQPPQPPFFGDYVWFDENRDGIQDATEAGMNGVRVELYTDDGDGIADPNVDALYGFTVTTNDGSGDGKYLFSYMPAANYFAVFYPPAGHLISPSGAGDDTVDSDGTYAEFGSTPVAISDIRSIAILQEQMDVDQGFYDRSALPAVWAIAELGGGSVVIGGKFQSSHGVPCGNIAVLGPNGTPSGGFNSGSGFDGVVRALAVTDDGRILVGGDFTSYDGNPANGLALLNADGTYIPGLAMPNVNDVRWVGASGATFYIAGGFSSLGGHPTPSIGRLHSTGTVDTGFSPGSGADGPIHCASVSGGGVIVGGSFGSYQGEPAAGLARINSDGSRDPSFDIGTGFDGPVNSIAFKGGMIFAVGDFSNCNDVPANGAARLAPNGAVDQSFGDSSLSVTSNRASN